MASALARIREDVDRVVQGVAAVLGLEVIVYDTDLTVVASTGGGSHTQPGSRVRGHVVGEVMRTGAAVVNWTPGFHDLCRPCALWGKCPEKADISCPILHRGEVVGVISLTAFNDEQSDLLRNRHPELLNFLGKMADLLSSKLTAQELLDESTRLADTLDVIIQSMHEGVLAVDGEGRLVQLNRSAERILGVSAERASGRRITEVLPGLPLMSMVCSGRGCRDKEVSLRLNGQKVSLLLTATPITRGHQVMGVVANLRDLREVRRLVTEMTGDKPYTFDQILGRSPQMLDVKQRGVRVARTDATVLITGESGVGKELFARAIHAESHRRSGPFRAINCAAIPEPLLESELFGYEEGAFTGASRKGKVGKFELADGGTLFLDEVGDMPLHLQAKLLRVLEERQLERIGGTEPITINVRIIAATNQNLEERVRRGEFRGDLYYRLNVIPLHIPPLRERNGDVELLMEHFMLRYGEVSGKEVRGFSPDARARLISYRWPGNVRELQNAVQYAVHMATGPILTPECLPGHLQQAEPPRAAEEPLPGLMPIREMENLLIQRALARFGTSVKGKRQAAEALGINLATLYRKLDRAQAGRFWSLQK